MSRSIIGGIVAIVIAALTATAYFVTTSRLSDDIRHGHRRTGWRGPATCSPARPSSRA